MHTDASSELWELPYRLKTARQKRRLVIKDRDKQLLKLSERKKELQKAIRALGWEDLSPPIQRGWKRTFVLREDVARSKQADFFQGILDKINTVFISDHKDFKVKKRKRGKKIYVPKNQKLFEPTNSDLKKLKFTESELQLFYPVEELSRTGKTWTIRNMFREPWRFVLKVQPNMITKVRKHDAVLKSALDEIESYIERNNLRPRMGRLIEGSYHNGWGTSGMKKRKKNIEKDHPLKNKSLFTILVEAYNDELLKYR